MLHHVTYQRQVAGVTLTTSVTLQRMSKDEGKKPVPKRFFIQSTDDIHKRLQHLAIDHGTSAEKLGGQFIAEAVARAEAELPKRPAKPKA